MQTGTNRLFFLIGMPGCGKSYWGKQIANYLHYAYVDLDSLVEERTGKTIQTMFENEGETYFRQQERDALTHVISHANTNLIVACGGGTPCFFDNMQLMNQAGITVYFDASISFLKRNLLGDPNSRPLLKDINNIDTRLEKILADRLPYYSLARVKLQAEQLNIITFAQILNDV
ncbi:MAG: shikimate kinase [Chitinophagia bacterium]|nr:shikimate kinase [Chitinophagia bacterium]